VDFADRGRYWRLKVTQGAAWNDINSTEAVNNAKAAFPDDYYEFTVTAKDAAGLSKDKTERVLLDNWEQTVNAPVILDPFVPPGHVRVRVFGTQFTANSTVKVYAVSTLAADGDSLSAAGQYLGTAPTDADGNIIATDFVFLPAGQYCIVADYHGGDGIYQPRLDAIIGPFTQEALQGAGPPRWPARSPHRQRTGQCRRRSGPPAAGLSALRLSGPPANPPHTAPGRTPRHRPNSPRTLPSCLRTHSNYPVSSTCNGSGYDGVSPAARSLPFNPSTSRHTSSSGSAAASFAAAALHAAATAAEVVSSPSSAATRGPVNRFGASDRATPSRSSRRALSGWSNASGITSCGTPAVKACAVVPIPPWWTTAAARGKTRLNGA